MSNEDSISRSVKANCVPPERRACADEIDVQAVKTMTFKYLMTLLEVLSIQLEFDLHEHVFGSFKKELENYAVSRQHKLGIEQKLTTDLNRESIERQLENKKVEVMELTTYVGKLKT